MDVEGPGVRPLARERGLHDASLFARDIVTLDEAERYDLLTAFDVIHDQKDPVGVLRTIYSVLEDQRPL